MQVIQLLVTGLAVGSIYALVALGFVLVYTAVNVVNFAQGDFSMVAAFFMVSLVVSAHLPYALGFVISVILAGVAGYLFQLGVYQPVKNRPRNFLPVMIATVGGSIFLQHLFLILYGPVPLQLPSVFKQQTVDLGGVHVYPQYLLIIAVTAVMVALLNWFFERTKLGKQMQATAQDPTTARLMGINTARMNALTFALSTALGGLAGILVAPVYMVTTTMGSLIGLKAFAASIVGGFSSVKGAIIGGLAIGIIETFGGTYISGAYRDAFAFIVLVLFLIFRPYGLFGEKVSQKV
ncbi:MAG: branched-chain amino acid ABC transporter permease [Alicyclobacillus macrosporangiidus]|uniref:branched-chain amino acid ABC transporter permease n=1 Tax=Alicyclobacillus macrosporangiidus TaxID=392015 RepID=UPI0026E9932C|nr:branched-chain amino acid ABC transporter permease [Alicyclobacillus macrosporangiidus]MCL6600583.1 branched-chain amino acid ABC transporter permease [Alicyclobacillus macrosporangiidus]